MRAPAIGRATARWPCTKEAVEKDLCAAEVRPELRGAPEGTQCAERIKSASRAEEVVRRCTCEDWRPDCTTAPQELGLTGYRRLFWDLIPQKCPMALKKRQTRSEITKGLATGMSPWPGKTPWRREKVRQPGDLPCWPFSVGGGNLRLDDLPRSLSAR